MVVKKLIIVPTLDETQETILLSADETGVRENHLDESPYGGPPVAKKIKWKQGRKKSFNEFLKLKKKSEPPVQEVNILFN